MTEIEPHYRSLVTPCKKSEPEIQKCSNCQSSQTNKQTVRGIQRARRSNSCPTNDIKLSQPKHSCHSRHVTIFKKWHSLQTVHNESYCETRVGGYESLEAPTNLEPTNTVWAELRNPGCAESQTAMLSLSKRVSSLFAIGAALALILNYLQKQKRVTIFPSGLFGDVLNSAWWIPPTFGFAAIVIGLLYPKIDELLGNVSKRKLEWPNVMRCIAVFVGINHASAKITFDSNIHLLITLTMMSLGLWYVFDQSVAGLGLGIAITVVAAFITQILVAMNVFGYSNPDFLYMQSWVLCLYFSGGVTVGVVGRALATVEVAEQKEHME